MRHNNSPNRRHLLLHGAQAPIIQSKETAIFLDTAAFSYSKSSPAVTDPPTPSRSSPPPSSTTPPPASPPPRSSAKAASAPSTRAPSPTTPLSPSRNPSKWTPPKSSSSSTRSSSSPCSTTATSSASSAAVSRPSHPFSSTSSSPTAPSPPSSTKKNKKIKRRKKEKEKKEKDAGPSLPWGAPEDRSGNCRGAGVPALCSFHCDNPQRCQIRQHPTGREPDGKVSDFGASRLVPSDITQLSMMVQGTFGYLDQEYMQRSQLTKKSDVYSFGMVPLELLTSRRAVCFDGAEEERNLASYFYTC